MLDIQLLRTDLENVAGLLATRGYSFPIPEFEALESDRKSLQTHTQELQARRNAAFEADRQCEKQRRRCYRSSRRGG